MSEEVGVEGGVKTTPGDKPYTGASSGDWTAGDVKLVLNKKLVAENRKAIYQAECTFKFKGNGPPDGRQILGSEKVVLKAGDTKLIGEAGGCLRVGDQVESGYGNMLEVDSSQSKLKTVKPER